MRRATRASAYRAGRGFKDIRSGLYRLRAGDITCPAASLAFARGLHPFTAHDPASSLGGRPCEPFSGPTREGASVKKGPDHVPPGASTTGFEPPGAGCEQKCTTMRRPTKKGPAPNRGAKEDDMPFPKSRGRGGELRDPVPADLFKLSDSSAPANSRHEKGPARRGRGLVGH